MEKSNFLKKTKSIILVTALLLSSLAVCSCNNKNNSSNEPAGNITATEQATEQTTENSTEKATEKATEEATEKATENSTKEANNKETIQNNTIKDNNAGNSEVNNTTQSDTTQSNTTQSNTTQTDISNNNEQTATEPPARGESNGISLLEQTIVDEKTGIEVSGMLPEDSEMYLFFSSNEFMIMSDNFELTIEHEIYNPTADKLKNRAQDYKQSYNYIDFYNSTYWSLSTEELEPDGVPCIEVYFVKDSQVLDFKSEFTITAPIDFRTFANSRKSDNNMFALYFNNDDCSFLSTEVLSAENTPANSFSFKAYTPGKYCFGNEEFLNRYLGFYDLDLSKLRVYNPDNFKN